MSDTLPARFVSLVLAFVLLVGCEKTLTSADLQDYDVFQQYADQEEVEALLLFLGSHDRGIRESAIVTLTRIKSEKAVVPIMKLLVDSNPHVANRAARSMLEIGDERTAPYIHQALVEHKYWSKDMLTLAVHFADERSLEVINHIRTQGRLRYQQIAAQRANAALHSRMRAASEHAENN